MSPILGLRRRRPRLAYLANCGTAAIELIEQHTLERLLSPELMLVDPELAERARALLREPHENNGKGKHMSALGTHEFTAGTSLGLEPPLSPPVVRGPMASAMPVGDGGLSELPTPPPAIRPPVAPPAPAPVQAEVPQQQPEPAAAPTPPPAPAPEPVQLEPALPEMAPQAPVEPAAPVIDYFATEAPATEPVQVEELPAVTPAPPVEPEPAPVVELHEIPLMAPAEPEQAPEPAAAAPVEPRVELPAVSPEPAAQIVAPEPVQPAIEPEPVVEPEPVAAVPSFPPAELTPEPAPAPVVEPMGTAEPVRAPELEELFAPKRATDFRVVVRLKDAEGVEVGSFRDFGTAMEGAQEVIEQFASATEGQWPFYAGRFIRPDLIVSVDVVEGEDEL